MRALIADRSAPSGVSLAEAPDPRAAPHEALVEVRASSLNRGEVRRLPARVEGTVPGWDVAGIVRDAAADGTGPVAGARVVGLVDEGAWAELAAVRTDRLAELPDAVSFEAASTLPIAGITAVRALEVAGPLLGRRVLVTGAAGGVGRFAVQLAHRAGAHVTGVVAGPERGAGLRELGADELINALEPDGDGFDLLLESIGGASLAAALTRVAPDGTVVSYGHSAAPEPTTFDVSRFYNRGAARLYGLRIWDELARHRSGVRDLTLLARELATGRLDPQIALTASWREPAGALAALIERRVTGKAVLAID
jgi:NADPH:quinone reductase